MSNRTIHGLNHTKRLLISAAAASALVGPVAIGLLIGAGHLPLLQAQPPTPAVAQTAPLNQITQSSSAGAPPTAPQRPVPGTPEFDVASIKPCNPTDDAGGRAGEGGKGGGGGKTIRRSPGRLVISCMTVSDLIEIAQAQFAQNPLLNDSTMPFEESRVRGGPSWARSTRYTIEAKTDNPNANGRTEGMNSQAFRLMAGPMLQRLLEDRFQLKSHRDTEEISIYALTVAKGGLKMKPMREGDCIPDGPPEWLAGGKPPCGWIGMAVNGPNRVLLGGAVPPEALATALGDMTFDRKVIDRTGITDRFLFRLEYAPDDTTRCFGPARVCAVDSTSDIPPGQSIFTALEKQLGLKLESIKGPHGFIVIDNVERPSEN